MKKHTSILIALCTIALVTSTSAMSHAQNFTIGIGPVGHWYIVDSAPQLDWGVGGEVWLDYRWSPQISTQFGVLVTTQDGKGPNSGDNGIEFLGIPTFDLKYYIMASDSKWDPYLLIGVGIYAISQGTVSNGTPAIGFGANAGIGLDYYLSQKFSIGLSTTFRSIGLVDSVDGANNGRALFPLSMAGYAGFHF